MVVIIIYLTFVGFIMVLFCWALLGWTKLGWVGLDCAWLGFVGMGWVGLGWVLLDWVIGVYRHCQIFAALLWLPDLMVEKTQTVIHFLYWTDWWISRQLVGIWIVYWGTNLCQCCKTSDYKSMYYLNESAFHANFRLSPAY